MIRHGCLFLFSTACATAVPQEAPIAERDSGALDASAQLDAAFLEDTGLGSFDGGLNDPITVVYGHSATTLFKMDPKTKAVTKVGDFDCDKSIIDLAIDEKSHAFITSYGGFFSLDLDDAKCKLLATGSYPNSLSFVPKGTLDPNEEALVGYYGGQYARIDTKSGAVTYVGALGGGYTSSGDIVSVINGGTFLTVRGSDCNDCLVQINPKTGALVKNFGLLEFSDVYGIAFWGGAVYGFTDRGQLFEVTTANNKLVTTLIGIPNAPKNLSFWGAGSSTSNPTTGVDGGIIPN